MNQKTIEKLLKLPDDDNEEFNWELYDKNGKITVDYQSIFNEDDFETLITIIKDTAIWVEVEEDYEARLKTGISDFQYVHCWRALALHQKEEVIDSFFAVFCLQTGSDLYFQEFINVFMPFRENQKVMQRLFDLFLASTTEKNSRLQISITEFFGDLYEVITPENQVVIEEIWIEKLRQEVSEDNKDEEYEKEKETLNGFILAELLDTKLAQKHYELIKELMEADLIDTIVCGSLENIEIEFGMREARTVPIFPPLTNLFSNSPQQETTEVQGFTSQQPKTILPKTEQKKKKNKKKVAKASKNKNRK